IHDLTALNCLLLFFADDGVHGEELWRSDGTREGTRLVKDINPGSGDSAPALASALKTTAVFQGKMFFAADDGTHGTELWKTDGTATGTAEVTVLTGPSGSDPRVSDLTAANGKLFMSTTLGLVASDGTAAGTSRLGTVTNVKYLTPF